MKTKRLDYLDSMRGFMALNVLLNHFVSIFFPQAHYYEFTQKIPDKWSLFERTPLSVFVNGNIAVMYFFILTGFLVSRQVILSEDLKYRDVIAKSVKRYFRLLPTVAVATVFTLITMLLKIQFHFKASEFALSGDFLNQFCNFQPDFLNVIKNIFIYPFISGSSYVGPFWTIKYEFIGYIACLLLMKVICKFKFRKIILILVSLLCIKIDVNYIGFFFGALIADIYCNDCEKFKSRFAMILFFAAGMYFACCPMRFTGIYKFWDKIQFLSPTLFRVAGMALIFCCIINCDKIKNFLSMKAFVKFGNISFAFYAIHWPLMLSLQCGLFTVFLKTMSYTESAFISLAITFIAVIPLSALTQKLCDWIIKSKPYSAIENLIYKLPLKH